MATRDWRRKRSSTTKQQSNKLREERSLMAKEGANGKIDELMEMANVLMEMANVK